MALPAVLVHVPPGHVGVPGVHARHAVPECCALCTALVGLHWPEGQARQLLPSRYCPALHQLQVRPLSTWPFRQHFPPQAHLLEAHLQRSERHSESRQPLHENHAQVPPVSSLQPAGRWAATSCAAARRRSPMCVMPSSERPRFSPPMCVMPSSERRRFSPRASAGPGTTSSAGRGPAPRRSRRPRRGVVVPLRGPSYSRENSSVHTLRAHGTTCRVARDALTGAASPRSSEPVRFRGS